MLELIGLRSAGHRDNRPFPYTNPRVGCLLAIAQIRNKVSRSKAAGLRRALGLFVSGCRRARSNGCSEQRTYECACRSDDVFERPG
jgi:hypothetical protein